MQIDTNIVQTLQKYLTDIIQIAEIVWKQAGVELCQAQDSFSLLPTSFG